MVSDVPTFERARRPEQKAQRRAAIQAAARELALERGVRNVTLGDIATAVGTAKSNVLRYFGTREEIYLQLLIDDLAEWGAALASRIEDDEVRGPAATAQVVAASFAARPLLSDLLSEMAATLEHNVRPELGRDFKIAMIATTTQIGETMRLALPGLGEQGGFEVAAMSCLFAGSLWSTCTTPQAILDLLDPELLAMIPATFEPRLERALHALYIGLPQI